MTATPGAVSGGSGAGETEVRRLRTLYQLLSTLSRARAVEDVYKAAIAALLDATEADRASILLFDDDGVMRFKAWHLLSESYREAVTGHTPWREGEADVRPVTVEDVLADPSLPDFQQVFANEDIRALAFIPLALDSGVFGKFMLYCRAPHQFKPDELEVAQAIATHVAFAVDRKRSELERARSEKRLQAILDNTATIIFLKDLQGRYILINRQCELLFGLTHANTAGKTDYELFPPDTAAHFVENDRRVLAAGHALTVEERVPQPDGIHNYIAVKFPIFAPDGTISGVGGISTDITDRQETEAAVRRLADLVENSWDAIIGADNTGQITSWNRSAERLFGYTPEEATGRALAMLIEPELLERSREMHARVWGGGTVANLQTRRRRKDGTVIDVSLTASPVRNTSGEIIGSSAILRDISEQKLAEEKLRQSNEALRESEDHYRHTVELDPQVPWTASPEGKLEDFSPQWLKLTGLTREEAMSAGWNQVPHPDDLPAMLRGWAKASRTGEMFDLEHRIRVADGSYRWMRTRARPRRDGTGAIIRWYGYTEDIDDRKRAEIELRRAKRQVENILGSIRQSFIALDREWRYTYVNERVVQRTRMTREQLLGRNVWEMYPESRAPFFEGFSRCMRERVPVQFESEYPVWDREEAPRHYEVHAYPTQEGICAYILDITARKGIERSARQLAGIVEATSDFIAIMKMDGKFVYMNGAGRAMLGIAGDADVTQLNCTSFCPSALADQLQGVWLPSAVQQGSFSAEGSLLTMDKREISVSFVFVGQAGANGEPEFVSAIARDITVRKQTEDALRKANAELEEFAFVSSHDLREPLRMIGIYTELLLRQFPTTDVHVQQYAEFIRGGVRRMESLIRDLLDYSRVIHADGERTEAADLSAALDQAIDVLKGRIAEAGALVIAERLPVVRGDIAHLATVLQNLLSNSLKYSREGIAPEIRVSARREGEQWIISVEDNGIGFEQKYADLIFRLFQRLHREEYEGTGLGLAICQRIIDRYGGRIWAEGRPGEGATFRLALPAVPNQSIER